MPYQEVKVIAVRPFEKWASKEDKERDGYQPEIGYKVEARESVISTFELPDENSECFSRYEALIGKNIMIPYSDGFSQKSGKNYRRVDPDVMPIPVGSK